MAAPRSGGRRGRPQAMLMRLMAVLLLAGAAGSGQRSKWRLPVLMGKKFNFGKILFSNTTIFLRFERDEKASDPSQSYNVTWYLRYSDCYNEVFNFGDERAEYCFGTTSGEHPGWSGYYATSSLLFQNCSELFRPQIFYREFVHPEPLSPEKQEGLKDKKESGGNHTMVADKTAMNAVIKTWRDGPYIFIMQIGITMQSILLPEIIKRRRKRFPRIKISLLQ
ncbi:transmembrane protein 87A-like [Pezoporus occidentalis]|uniref:transmembrane protein 87A-like n=1 Tax=Pezoporus occidentalis TaxID=407982 RepID=UPI002F913E52